MKKSFKHLLAATVVASQFIAGHAFADQSKLERITEKVKDKIKNSSISASVSLDLLNFEIDDAFSAGNGIRYRYVLDADMGKFLRQDKWSDYVYLEVSPGVAMARRELRRDAAFGRFFERDQWSTALKTFLFSPLDLKNLSSEKVLRLIDEGKIKAGDVLAVTLDKVTFLGLAGGGNYGGVGIHGRLGKAWVGKLTAKLFVKKDKQIQLVFADADENSIQAGGDVKIGLGIAGIDLKILSIDQNFRLRGNAELETFTYDLSRGADSKAAKALDKVLGALDNPSVLFDKSSLNQLIQVTPSLSKGLINITESQMLSDDVTSGVTRQQQVNNNIVGGAYGRTKFSLLPRFLESTNEHSSNINLVDIKLSGTWIKPGQYIIGYKSKTETERAFAAKERINNVTSYVYKPTPELTRPADANGYRGLADLIGLSYHTDSQQNSNPKEMITYAKLCNAGVVNCPRSIDLRVVDPQTQDARGAQGRSRMNSNYFFTKGLFEKIKERMNFDRSSDNQNRDSIQQALAPVVREMVVSNAEDQNKEIQRMTNMFHDVLKYNCYSNLSGMNATVAQSNWFKRTFNPKCSSNLYSINDEVIRLNMPTLLISLFDPNMLPSLSEPSRRASPDQIRELSKVFSVAVSTRAVNTDGDELMVNGQTFGLSLEANMSDASQISEFNNLVSIWQHQKNMDLNHFDRMKMIELRN
ncbi:MAG: hypothetical protein K0R29_1805 [Pseudobdellovibrio sp.]|jgi:hypothetical protein|nr:hypothetical protein [Pseudobdellovibrio sp.]